MLDDPKIWAAIEALAAFLEGNSTRADGSLWRAPAANTGDKYAVSDGEDGGGLKVLTACGLTPTYWADEGVTAA